MQPDRRAAQGLRLPGWTALLLVTRVLTSARRASCSTQLRSPPEIIGALSLVILAAAIVALYVTHLAGAARWIHIVSAVLALWFNAFGGAQHALAPTQKELPLFAAQFVVLALFVALAARALSRLPARAIRSVV
jgi:hypothetical protein